MLPSADAWARCVEIEDSWLSKLAPAKYCLGYCFAGVFVFLKRHALLPFFFFPIRYKLSEQKIILALRKAQRDLFDTA